MRTGNRKWLIWYKKQVGFDGVWMDAVKHFPDFASEDFLYNLQSNAGWANGWATMYAVGEWVGSSGQMDGWVANVNNRAGTFDFSLRNGLYQVVSQGGSFDIGTLLTYQQGTRVVNIGGTYVHRTVPFVNNHDTMRPTVDATGNYTGWNTGSELAPHIDPFDPRLSAVYAAALAMDGSPMLFFEDVFNVGNTSKRYMHSPKSTVDLPTRDDLVNLVWCHQNLHFKDGAYKVRYQTADHLVIERSTKAIIGINDNFTTWQNNTVSCDFPAGTVPKDYSGANGYHYRHGERLADGDYQHATLQRHGRQRPARLLGVGPRQRRDRLHPPRPDHHPGMGVGQRPRRLRQPQPDAGRRAASRQHGLPHGRPHLRGRQQRHHLHPFSRRCHAQPHGGRAEQRRHGGEQPDRHRHPHGHLHAHRRGLVHAEGQKRQHRQPQPGGAFVKATYTAPTVVTEAMTGRRDAAVLAAATKEAPAAEVLVYPNPTAADHLDVVITANREQAATVRLHDLTGRLMHQETVRLYHGSNELRLGVKKVLPGGIYQLSVPEFPVSQKVAVQ